MKWRDAIVAVDVDLIDEACEPLNWLKLAQPSTIIQIRRYSFPFINCHEERLWCEAPTQVHSKCSSKMTRDILWLPCSIMGGELFAPLIYQEKDKLSTVQCRCSAFSSWTSRVSYLLTALLSNITDVLSNNCKTRQDAATTSHMLGFNVSLSKWCTSVIWPLNNLKTKNTYSCLTTVSPLDSIPTKLQRFHHETWTQCFHS